VIYLGIDPGKSGGIAWLFGAVWHVEKFDGKTEADIWRFFEVGACGADAGTGVPQPRYAVIEKVSSSPQMGVKSAFTFGDNFGFWRGCLTAAQIPFALVSPQKWQKAMGCLTKGDKNVSKAAAQRLYPNEKITHATADCLLLATYARRHHAELF
jgi:hypothetical protein